jgi:hypothetical protein
MAKKSRPSRRGQRADDSPNIDKVNLGNLDPALLRVIGMITLESVLRADVLHAREGLENDDPTEYHRRQYVRAVFAQLEGSTFTLKQLALPSDTSSLTDAELALLRGETYRLNDAGKALVSPAHLTLASDMRFAFRTYAKSVGLRYELPVTEPGWSALLRAKKIRDRLMHPRTAKDLEVTDPELACTTEAAEWFQRQSQEIAALMMDQIARDHGMSDAEVDAFREQRKQIVREQMAKREARRDGPN